VDLIEMHLEHEAVVGLHPAAQCLHDLFALRFEPTVGKIGKLSTAHRINSMCHNKSKPR
jgi:hypothetical protein